MGNLGGGALHTLSELGWYLSHKYVFRPAHDCCQIVGVLYMFVELGCVYQRRLSQWIMRNKWLSDWELSFISLKKHSPHRGKKKKKAAFWKVSEQAQLSRQIHAWVSTAVDDCREGLLMTSFRLLMTKPLSKMSSKLLKTSLKVLKLMHCNKEVINLAAWVYHQDKMLSADPPCCCLSAFSSPFRFPFPWRVGKGEIHPFSA